MRTYVVTLALLVACGAQFAATQPSPDCTARHGPGCLKCENVTITAPDGYQQRYGDGMGDSYRRGWRGRRLKHGGFGGRSGWGPGPGNPGTRLVCVECDTGYVLATRPNSTYGSCRCAPGWGSQPVNSSSTDAPWGEHHRGGLQCIDCGAEGKVPLTDKANLRLSWDGNNWVLVLADGASSSSVGAQHVGGGGGEHQGWGPWRALPPFRPGQCVSCPTGSKASDDHTSCVSNDKAATGPTTPPSPSPDAPPPDASPTPDAPTPASPAPPSSEYGACLTVSTEDTDALVSTISKVCRANATDAVPLDAVGVWSDDQAMPSVWFATDPQIMTAPGLTPNDLSMAECSLMAGLPSGSTVTVTWLVNDTGITCSPATGTFTFTVPGLGQSSSQEVIMGAGLPINMVPVPTLTAPTATGPSFRRVARKAQQPATPVPTDPVVVGNEAVLTAAAVATAPVATAAVPQTVAVATVAQAPSGTP